jgi:hypothetical protein
MSLFSSNKCENVRAELDRHLALKTFHEYQMYVECFGALPTQEFNEIWASIVEDEEAHSAVYIIATPPGFGKTFLLLRLKEEFEKVAEGPVLYYSFASNEELFRMFVSNFKNYVAEAVKEWIQRVTGKPVEHAPPDFVLSLLVALRVTGKVRRLPLLVLLDDVPADVEKLEQFLRGLDDLGLDAYVIISLHELKDLDAFMNALAAKGGIARYGRIKPITQITLAIGQDEDAVKFIRKLSGGGLDEAAERIVVEMLKRGFGIRHAITFILGARRPLGGEILQSYEGILHKNIVAKLKEKLEVAKVESCQRALKIASRPDLFLKDCTCVEVKVRRDSGNIPIQHACEKMLYIVVSPKPVTIQRATVIHVRADVARLLAGYDEVRKRAHSKEVADRLMELMAEVLAERAADQIKPPTPPREVLEICSVLVKIFGNRDHMRRSDLTKIADFKRLLSMLAEKSKTYGGKLAECTKARNPTVDCVDNFARAVQEVYRVEPLKVSVPYVYLNTICREQGRGL